MNFFPPIRALSFLALSTLLATGGACVAEDGPKSAPVEAAQPAAHPTEVREPAQPPSATPSVLPAAAPADPAAQQKDPYEPELGFLGYQPPEVTDVRLPDAIPHQDKDGGNTQFLIALTGARGGGFAAIWRDQRDGALGLYMARFGADGALLEPEQPICEPHSGRRIEPSVALVADGSGAVTWT
jgi:hypothetical protein